MFPRSLGQLRAGQHARHFLGAFFPGNLTDSGLRAARGLTFLDQVVVIGKGRDLRQVSNAEHLIPFSKRLQLLPDRLSRTSSDARGVVSVAGKGPLSAGQVCDEKTNVREPLLTHR